MWRRTSVHNYMNMKDTHFIPRTQAILLLTDMSKYVHYMHVYKRLHFYFVNLRFQVCFDEAKIKNKKSKQKATV